MLSDLANTTETIGHAWNVSFRHVHPTAAVRNLTNHKVVENGLVRIVVTIVVTHRARVVAKSDLERTTAKTIPWKRCPLGDARNAAQAFESGTIPVRKLKIKQMRQNQQRIAVPKTVLVPEMMHTKESTFFPSSFGI